MKVLKINCNYNKNIQFKMNESYSTENWVTLRDILSQTNNCRFNEKAILNTGYLPTLEKNHFEYSDYKNLSPKERLIINLLNKKGANLGDSFSSRNDISIKKDAERIFEVASKVKEYFDYKYKNGYKLVGIGNSPAPIVETMQLLGADASTLPFTRAQIEFSPVSRDFPYEHWVPECDEGELFSNSSYGHFEKCSAKDWEEYFCFYGIDKDFQQRTGKTLIFTDYVADGWTKKYFESILEGLGFDKNYEFIETLCLLPHGIKLHLNYSLFRCLDGSSFKDYAKMESPRQYIRKIDIIKHPEYIPSLPEKLKSKLFHCALYDLMKKK